MVREMNDLDRAHVGRRALAVAAAVAACRAPAATARDAGARDVAVAARAPADVATPDAGPCAVVFPRGTELPVPVGGDDAWEFEAACGADRLWVMWRANTSVGAASRRLRVDAPWVLRPALGSDARRLALPMADAAGEGALHGAWVTADGALRVAHLDDARTRVSLPQRLAGDAATIDAVHVLEASGDVARMAVGRTVRGRAEVLDVTAGGAAAPAVTRWGDGVLVASATSPSFVATARRAPTGGPWTLTGRTFGDVNSAAEVVIGPGRFEFVARTLPGVVVFETVLGAERGGARVAWFGAGDRATVTPLPAAPTGLRDLDETLRGASLLYWNDARALTRATISRAGLRDAVTLGASLARDADVLAAQRDLRVVSCGGGRWWIRVVREGDAGGGHIEATREGCTTP